MYGLQGFLKIIIFEVSIYLYMPTLYDQFLLHLYLQIFWLVFLAALQILQPKLVPICL